jgi:hypothetical protein
MKKKKKKKKNLGAPSLNEIRLNNIDKEAQWSSRLVCKGKC